MRKIAVVAYDTSWQEKFEAEKSLILSTIALDNVLVHHIGSTSVAGLAAKPIIDILMEVDDVRALDSYSIQFERIGYECMGEFGIAGRRYFRKGGGDRSHQIHAFNAGSKESLRHLAFRDYLIAHKDVAGEYADIKYCAAAACNNDIDVYCSLKNDFVAYHEQLALKWFHKT